MNSEKAEMSITTDDNEYSQLSQLSDSSSVVRSVNFTLFDKLINRAIEERDLDGMVHLAEIAEREVCSADAMIERQMIKTLIIKDNGKLDIIKNNITKTQKLRNKIRNLRYVIDNITREKQIAEIETNKGKNIINQAINDIDKEVEELVKKANRLKDTANTVGDRTNSTATKLTLLRTSERTIQDMKQRLAYLEDFMNTIPEQGATDAGIFSVKQDVENAITTGAHQFAQAISSGANACSLTIQSALSSMTSFLTFRIANRISRGLLTETEKTSEVFDNLLKYDAPNVALQIIDNEDKTEQQLDDEYSELSQLHNYITERLPHSNSNPSSQNSSIVSGYAGLDPGSIKASDEDGEIGEVVPIYADGAIDEDVATEINALHIPELINEIEIKSKKDRSPPSSQHDVSDNSGEDAQPKKKQTTEASKESVFGILGGRKTQKRRRNHKKHHNTKRAKKRYTRKLHKNHKRRRTKKH